MRGAPLFTFHGSARSAIAGDALKLEPDRHHRLPDPLLGSEERTPASSVVPIQLHSKRQAQTEARFTLFDHSPTAPDT